MAGSLKVGRGGMIPWPLLLLSVVYGLESMFTLIISHSGVQTLFPRSALTSVASITTPLAVAAELLCLDGADGCLADMIRPSPGRGAAVKLS